MVTVKISENGRALLKTLAAFHGNPMHEVAEMLFTLEVKKLGLKTKQPKPAPRNGRKGNK